MRSVSFDDFLADIEGWCDVAEHQSIALTENGAEVFVLLPIADLHRLSALAETVAPRPAEP